MGDKGSLKSPIGQGDKKVTFRGPKCQVILGLVFHGFTIFSFNIVNIVKIVVL